MMSHESGFDVTVSGGPNYHVGQDGAGRWLAMESSGRGGGMFATREAALRFARRETSHRPGAVTVSSSMLGFA